MLSAAHDILSDGNTNNGTETNRTGKLVPDCNPIGTGAVLLADIIPTLVVKLSAPFYMHLIPYNTRVALIIAFGAVSFPLVAFGRKIWVSLAGVVCASIGAGFGEITFLSLSSFFHRDVVSTWSSGTGGAGVFGALSYAGLTAAGLSPRNTLLVMLVIPTSMAACYYCLMVLPPGVSHWTRTAQSLYSERQHLLQSSDSEQEDTTTSDIRVGSTETSNQEHESDDFTKIGFKMRIKLIKPLLKYMVPLGLVYFAEYFINQGIVELISFEDAWLPAIQQYRWYQVIYQIGVFISRSSVNLVHIKHTWIMAFLQFANVAVLLCQVFFQFIPNIWIVFILILYEGLLGGAAYVNTFYRISQEVQPEYREYSLGIASVSDSLGITIAGFISVPVHNKICKL